jgi:hypothetical protein
VLEPLQKHTHTQTVIDKTGGREGWCSRNNSPGNIQEGEGENADCLLSCYVRSSPLFDQSYGARFVIFVCVCVCVSSSVA